MRIQFFLGKQPAVAVAEPTPQGGGGRRRRRPVDPDAVRERALLRSQNQALIALTLAL